MRWTELLSKLGSQVPEDWVHDDDSQADAKASIARFLFLREAAGLLVRRGEDQWIENLQGSAERDPDGPFSGSGLAIASLREKGATNAELRELVRAVQGELLSGVCYLLDGLEVAEPALEDSEIGPLDWRLTLVDEMEKPGEIVLTGLHESVLAADPDGHEMRPVGLD